jgi:hypothetical protein
MGDLRFSLRNAVAASCIAAAGTAGLLIGAGRRGGDSIGPFLLAGRALLDSRDAQNLFVPAATAMIGILHHVAAVILWGTLIAVVASMLRPIARVIAVIAATAAVGWAGGAHLPVLGRLDLPATASLRWPLHIVLAVALLMGLWAVRPSQRASR